MPKSLPFCYNDVMLYQAFPKLKMQIFSIWVREFYDSPAYPAFVVLLMMISEIFGLEVPVYTIYLLLLFGAVLFTEDTFCFLPVACCGYMTLSTYNNPARNPESSAFSNPAFFVFLAVAIGIAFTLFLVKAFSVLFTRGTLRRPRLLFGLLALGLAYVLGGLGPHYSLRTALFGALEFASLAVLYFFFVLTVDWDRVDKAYLPMLFALIGIGLCAQIANMYTNPGVFTAQETVDRTYLYTGWGIYNNVACIMAMCIPAPFYYAAKRGRVIPGLCMATLFLLATAATQSRGGILFGSVVYLAGMGSVFIAVNGRDRLKALGFVLVLAAVGGIGAALFSAQFGRLFASLAGVGMQSNGRLDIYRNCWDAFVHSPVFGVGFYDTPGYALPSVGGFLPPRAHNTLFQLLASGGLVALLAYLFHRVQTVRLLFRHPSCEKTFAALSIAAMLLTSLLDCHFFNFGPGLLYGVLLAYAEGMDGAAHRALLS